jgi:hypothetical protein
VAPDVVDFLRDLGRPTMIRQRGREDGRARIVTTLLHGNEPSGAHAIHAWLRSGRTPASDTLFFIAGIEAALEPAVFEHRVRSGGSDLNRCWLPPFEGPEGQLAQQALRLMRESGAECLVDLHNNTGHNPPYGIGPDPGAAELNIVAFFGDRFVYSPLRLGTIVEATRDDFPSVTVECGRSGDPSADTIATKGLERFLDRETLELRRLEAVSTQILTDPVRVCVSAGTELAFGDHSIAGADLTVDIEIDRHNFEELAPGTHIGWTGSRDQWPLLALGERDEDLSHHYFEARDGKIVTRRPLIPIMMTTNRDNALIDCLFYIVRDAPKHD